MNNCYVYTHTRLDNNTVFYVGIGTHKARNTKHSRANETTRRTRHWKNIAAKTNYKIEIVFDNITWQKACELEIELISTYKRYIDGGTLCNLTLGGEGAMGRIVKQEVRDKISKSLQGHLIKDETKAKIRQTLLQKDYIPSKTHRKVIDTNTGQIYSTIQDAANSINMKRTTLYMQLIGKNKSSTNFKFA